MKQLSIDGNFLIFEDGRIDLTSALKVKMCNKVETREYFLSSFEVGNVYPCGGSLRVHLRNLKEGLIIPLVFRQEKSAFRVSIPSGEIVEQFGISRKILEIGLLPEFLASKVGDDGYFMLPTFSGTLVKFKEHLPTVNRDRIYMEQGEWEKFTLLNCFAMKKGAASVLGIVTKGDFHCWITSELNQSGINRIYPSFGLRHHAGELRKQEIKEILYCFSTGREADYPGMARRYRDYLVNERCVSPLKERLKGNPTLAYSVDAMRVKIFMGLKHPYVVDGSSPMQKYTTFGQAGKILDKMKASGIGRAVITLVGWNLGGHDGAYPTRFPVEPELGGESGLRKLIRKALLMGYQIVPHDNVTDVYRAAPDFDYEYTARTEYDEALPAGLWGGGQSFKSCPAVYMDRYGNDFTRIKDLGFSGHYYMDAQSTVMWQCHDRRHPADEEQFAKSLAAIAQLPREMYGAVAIECGSAFSLPFVDEVGTIQNGIAYPDVFNNCPANFCGIVDRCVPFYQIAVHGLVTYQGTWVHHYRNRPGGVERGLLQELAFGARPSMEVSYVKNSHGDLYTNSIKNLKDACQRNFTRLKGLHVETIEEFEELSHETYKSVYSNGTSIAVNFGQKNIDDMKPMSVKIKIA